jgi:hypothetical protein
VGDHLAGEGGEQGAGAVVTGDADAAEPATSSWGSASSARGNISEMARWVAVAQRAGRDQSTTVKSPG